MDGMAKAAQCMTTPRITTTVAEATTSLSPTGTARAAGRLNEPGVRSQLMTEPEPGCLEHFTGTPARSARPDSGDWRHASRHGPGSSRTDGGAELRWGYAPGLRTGDDVYAATNVGIDLGITTKHRACALGADGSKRVMSFGPTPAELDALLDAIGGPDHVDVVLEPTGLSWVAPSVYLAERGVCVHRVDTRKAHGFRKILSRDVKSDQADAEAWHACWSSLRPRSGRSHRLMGRGSCSRG